MRSRSLRFLTVLVPLMALMLLPASASAQRRRPPVYPPIYPPIYYPPMYPVYRLEPVDAGLRIQVTPKEAAVYVDGYYAGQVEEFDGAFQRLRVLPGQHEVVVYLDGYRSLHERLYLSPNTTRKIAGALEPLAPGEPHEPVPEPAAPPRALPRPLAPRDRGTPPPDARGDEPQPPQANQAGSVSIRVQPPGGSVRIDGESWVGPSDDERLIVHVPPGRHTIEVRRPGFEPFVTTVDVPPGETVPINISLIRR